MDSKALIERELGATINKTFRYLPVVTLTGPRQSGKTTLCRMMFKDLPYANLEDISVRAELANDPKGFLAARPHCEDSGYL